MSETSRQAEVPTLSSEASGLSQFAMRVLDQLSLSSWLPAAFVVGMSMLLIRLDAQPKPNLSQALESLSAESFGLVIVLIFAVVIAAMLIQAFEFSAIRILEGYWPSLFSVVGITGSFVRLQGLVRRFRRSRVRGIRKRAFREAREKLLDLGEDQEVIRYLQATAYGENWSGTADPGLVAAAGAVGWEAYVSPGRLRRLEAAERAFQGYPTPHRLMPTRLGNRLRAAEDDLRLADGQPLRTFVLRNWHLLTNEQRRLHNEYRNRLDLYCSMVMACGGVAILGVVLFLTGDTHVTAALVCAAVFGGLVLVCYQAAITAAEGYGGALRMVRDQALAAAAGSAIRTV